MVRTLLPSGLLRITDAPLKLAPNSPRNRTREASDRRGTSGCVILSEGRHLSVRESSEEEQHCDPRELP